MEAHEQRAVKERDDLQAKIVKLDAFMETSLFEGMPYEDRKFMRIQWTAMLTYCEALNARIGRFT